MSAITAKASRKMKKYAVLTREPRCFLGSFDFSWEQRKFSDITFPAGEKNKDNLPLESYSITNEHGFVPQDEKFENGGTMREADKRMYYIVSPNSFAYNPARINVGSIGYQNIGKNVIVSSLYEVFKTSEDVDDRLLWHWFKSPDFQKLIMQLQEGGVRLYFYYDKLCMGEVSLPSLEEQRKIGKLFNTLDNLITLHQRKCVFLFGFFQAFISMIFTASTFSWEQRKLGELVDRVVRKNTNNESTLPLTISAQYGLVDQITYFNNRVASRDVSNYYLVLNGEFAYNKSTSDGYPFGAVKRLDLYEKGVLSTLYIVFTPKKEQQINSDFLTVFFDTDRWHKGVAERAAEGARNHGLLNISAEDFFDIDLSVPKDVAEQKQIGVFIRQLDHLITLHQRECISFTARAGRLILTANKKRNTSSWEQRKFEEIAVRSSVICSDDTLPRVEYEDIVSGTGRLNKDIYAKQSIKSGIAFHQGDVLYGKLRPYLQNWLLPTFDGLAVGDFWVLQPQNADSSFLYRLIQSRQFDEVANQSTGTKMPRADWKLVSKTVFSIPPNISEQAAIGTYFTALDSLITLHQRKPFLMKWRTSDANRNQTNRLVL